MINNKRAISLLLSCLFVAVTFLLTETNARGVQTTEHFLPFVVAKIMPLKPYLVLDINPKTPSSFIYCPVFLGNKMLCSARDNEHGYELWQSNGRSGGSSFLKDIKPGDDSYALHYHSSFAKLNDFVLFSANASNADLWRTDGSEAGTVLVKGDFWSMDSQEPFTVAGDLVYFMANDGDHGFELWRSDGTAVGTYFLKEMFDGYYAGIRGLTALGHDLYFMAEGEEYEYLWVTDGTSPGTKAVPAMTAIPVNNLAPLQDFLIIDGLDTTAGYWVLWRTDGTAAGTVRLADYGAGETGGIYEMAGLDTRVVFTTFHDNLPGWGIGGSDGSGAGTLLEDNISTAGRPYNLTAAGAQAFFLEEGDPDEKHALWRTDGTAGGTRKLALFQQPDETFCPPNFFPWEGALYFTADDGQNGCELWRSDGTAAGTQLVADIAPGAKSSWPRLGVLFQDQLYFQATDANDDAELWRSDGTAFGTVRADDAIDFPSESSFPRHLIAQPQGIYFSARTGSDQIGLWSSDGRGFGTEKIKSLGSDSIANPLSSASWAMVGDNLYFITDFPNALWRSDGTESGTIMLSGPEECGSPYLLAPVGDKLYFFAAARGDWLCLAGMPSTKIHYVGEKVHDASPGDSLLFFRTSEKIGVSDGTAAGTKIHNTPVLNLGPVFNLASIGDTVYFNGCASATQDCELWRLKGLAAAPQRVVDISSEANGSRPNSFIPAGAEIFFEATLAPYGPLLWRSNGTAEGTAPVAQLDLCAQPELGSFAALLNGRLYFPALDHNAISSQFGCELWATDGTFEGTYLVQDITAGPNSSQPAELTAAGAHVAFTAEQPASGCQIWISDGTGPGTVRITGSSSAVAGPQSAARSGSCPDQLTLAGGRIFFNGTDAYGESELWAFIIQPAQ